MTNLKIDYSKKTGKIKPMHAVGVPPLIGIDTSYFSYLKEANIPYSRLHDVGGFNRKRLRIVSNPESFSGADEVAR